MRSFTSIDGVVDMVLHFDPYFLLTMRAALKHFVYLNDVHSVQIDLFSQIESKDIEPALSHSLNNAECSLPIQSQVLGRVAVPQI